MDKYYTPEINEFFVGFQYEEKGDLQGWYKTEFGDSNGEYNNEVSEVSWGINHDKIRVKYLSQEDIESLGFNQISDDCFNLSIKEYRGRLNQEVRILIIQTVLIYLAMDMTYNDKNNLVLFTGNIKNKSELIKLLKQLGIE